MHGRIELVLSDMVEISECICMIFCRGAGMVTGNLQSTFVFSNSNAIREYRKGEYDFLIYLPRAFY